ncbi:hypothetical protein [Tropicibacter naphthalenivorans]|uniref:Uncharacterized protein n=1 Tax=Tropicibacter naphthalenivorans TaxID=441103 RepID=A0A0P1GYE7_9RHOB|nr:hypothetical protein [Tropicibacter naphthalenivorans]CUH80935.1 hypothetical protein TRN7648_03244 [Tropicibacter naphthalenivorans]SMC91261.1 hypothetical protein SAMN04488093_106216 [Tropicibacter naphthalenivorans]
MKYLTFVSAVLAASPGLAHPAQELHVQEGAPGALSIGAAVIGLALFVGWALSRRGQAGV